jgi:predicted Zn-dependent protease
VEYRINKSGTTSFKFKGQADVSSPADISDNHFKELRSAVKESFSAWTEPECTNLSLVEGEPTENDEATYNQSEANMNVVVWRDEQWPYASDTAFALTSVTFPRKTGIVHDADIEINSDTYTFSNLKHRSNSLVDLRNTVTHEVGHLIGLAHTSKQEATMYGSASVGEINKRTLHSDDEKGVCSIYPADEDDERFKPNPCADPGDNGTSQPIDRPNESEGNDSDNGNETPSDQAKSEAGILGCSSIGDARVIPLSRLVLLVIFGGALCLRRRRNVDRD